MTSQARAHERIHEPWPRGIQCPPACHLDRDIQFAYRGWIQSGSTYSERASRSNCRGGRLSDTRAEHASGNAFLQVSGDRRHLLISSDSFCESGAQLLSGMVHTSNRRGKLLLIQVAGGIRVGSNNHAEKTRLSIPSGEIGVRGYGLQNGELAWFDDTNGEIVPTQVDGRNVKVLLAP